MLTDLSGDDEVALDPGLRRLFEGAFDEDFSAVRVGWGARAMASANVVILPVGEFSLWLLGHELAHVVQQRRRGVAAADTVPLGEGYVLGRPGGVAEAEADAAADAVMVGRRFAFAGAARPVPAGTRLVQAHSSWEHRLLGDIPKERMQAIANAINAKKPNPQGEKEFIEFFSRQLNLMRAWADGKSMTDKRIWELAGWDVPLVRLPNCDTTVTIGELNALADYLPNPMSISSIGSEYLNALVATIREESHEKLGRHFFRLKRKGDTKWVGSVRPCAKFTDDPVKWFPDLLPASDTVRLQDLSKQYMPRAQSYNSVLCRNACHFAPYSWYRWEAFHLLARQRIEEMRTANPSDKPRLELEARLNAAYADHFLQDSFAAGHLINKTLVMQWYVEYLLRLSKILPRSPRPLEEYWPYMTTERQPDLAAWELYDRTRPNPRGITDPQTADEEKTLEARMRRSGVIPNKWTGSWGTERWLTQEEAYAFYLNFLSSRPIQVGAGLLHNHLNEVSLTVAAKQNDAGVVVWGDDTFFNGGGGIMMAAEAADASRRAIEELLRTNRTSIEVQKIFDMFPKWVFPGGGKQAVSLEDWHKKYLQQIAIDKVFRGWTTTGAAWGMAVRNKGTNIDTSVDSSSLEKKKVASNALKRLESMLFTTRLRAMFTRPPQRRLPQGQGAGSGGRA